MLGGLHLPERRGAAERISVDHHGRDDDAKVKAGQDFAQNPTGEMWRTRVAFFPFRQGLATQGICRRANRSKEEGTDGGAVFVRGEEGDRG